MITVLTNAQIISVAIPMLLGIVIGLIIGSYFCQKNYIGVNVSKEELREALIKSDISEYIASEEAAKDALDATVEEVETTIDTMAANGASIYNVVLSTLIAAESDYDALSRTLDSLKKRKGLMFKHGAIDIYNTYVEKVEFDDDKEE